MDEIENEEVFEEEVVEEETTDESNEEEQIDWQARAEKAEATIVKSKDKAKKSKPEAKVETDNEATLARLENRGVMDTEDQAYVLRFAKAEGVSPVEALQDQIVIDRMAANKQARQTEQAKPTSNNRTTNGQVNDLAKATARYKKDGTLPTDIRLTNQILENLSNEA
jgi:hypothetical protein